MYFNRDKGFTRSVNTSHPGGQAYYQSLVDLYEQWGVRCNLDHPDYELITIVSHTKGGPVKNGLLICQ